MPQTPTPQVKSVVQRPLTDLFSRGAASLPEGLRQIDLRMGEQEVRKRVEALASTNAFSPEGFADVTLRLQFFTRSRQIRLIQVEVPGGARSLLTQLWGEPMRVRDDLDCWLNEQAGLQVTVGSDDTALVHAYRPSQVLLGDGEKFGFATTPLLGRELADIESTYPDYLIDSAEVTPLRAVLMLPPVECSREPTYVDLRIDRGRVTRVHLKLPYLGDEARKQTLLRTLQAKYGGPVAQRGTVVTYRLSGPKVLVEDDPATAMLSIFVSTAHPVATGSAPDDHTSM